MANAREPSKNYNYLIKIQEAPRDLAASDK